MNMETERGVTRQEAIAVGWGSRSSGKRDENREMMDVAQTLPFNSRSLLLLGLQSRLHSAKRSVIDTCRHGTLHTRPPSHTRYALRSRRTYGRPSMARLSMRLSSCRRLRPFLAQLSSSHASNSARIAPSCAVIGSSPSWGLSSVSNSFVHSSACQYCSLA